MLPNITVQGIGLGMLSMFLFGIGVAIVMEHVFISWWSLLGLLFMSPTVILTNIGADCFYQTGKNEDDSEDCE